MYELIHGATQSTKIASRSLPAIQCDEIAQSTALFRATIEPNAFQQREVHPHVRAKQIKSVWI